MSGPVGVMSILLLEAAVGGLVVLWGTGVAGAVRRGFLLLLGVTVALCAWGSWALLAGVPRPADPALHDRATAAALAFAAMVTLWQLLVLARRQAAARIAGLVATAAGLVAVVLLGLTRADDALFAVAELGLGTLFLGSTMFGLLLGHWYLVERKLPNAYMVRSAWWYIAGVAAAVAGAALSARNPAPDPGRLSVFLQLPGFSVLLSIALVAICALIAGFVWKLAKEGGRSIQAATGMFYLAVIMAFSAELSSKVRFF
jgi:hypothetical protein